MTTYSVFERQEGWFRYRVEVTYPDRKKRRAIHFRRLSTAEAWMEMDKDRAARRRWKLIR